MLKPSSGKTASEEGREVKRLEIGEFFRVGYRSVSEERRGLRDRLSDDQNVQDLFKGLLGKCAD